MSDLKINIRFLSGIFGGVFGAFAGNTNALILALIMIVAIELLCIHSLAKIARKSVLFLFIALGALIDVHVVKSGFVIKNAVACFYIANEIISMTEGIKLEKKRFI